jgi:hypothetical protein
MAQAALTVSTSLFAVHYGPPLYLPEVQDRHGRYFPRVRLTATGRATLVVDVATGVLKNVTHVLGFDVERGNAWDASSEIAQAVLERLLRRDSRIPDFCLAFLEKHLGIRYVQLAATEAFLRC